MQVYRLCRRGHTALDGEGARLYGGRWNSAGRRVLYTSESLALAALELLVHIPAALAPTDLVALTIDIPDDLVAERIEASQLPTNWFGYADGASCRLLGDAWFESGNTALLRAPAAPVPEEHNFLVNLTHDGAQRVGVLHSRAFHFDPRLVK